MSDLAWITITSAAGFHGACIVESALDPVAVREALRTLDVDVEELGVLLVGMEVRAVRWPTGHEDLLERFRGKLLGLQELDAFERELAERQASLSGLEDALLRHLQQRGGAS